MDGNEATSYGYSALHTAVISRNLKAVRALTTATNSTTCDLDSRDSMGFTALHLATLQGNKELVEMLMQAGCDINSRTKEGMTSLHISSERSDAQGIVSALATDLCDVSARNKLGRTALHLAAKLGNLENLRVLLDAGCDRNIKDKLGFTAVGLAFKFNQKGSADILLRYRPRRNRSSSKESVLDENENIPVKRDDPEGKLHTYKKDCVATQTCSRRQNNERTTSSKVNKDQNSFHKLCNQTILRQLERALKGKALPWNIYHVMLFLLKQRRNKLDGLPTSRKTRCVERKILTLILDSTSLIHFPFVLHSVGTLDAKVRQLCLCDLKTSVDANSRNVASDLLTRLLRDLKDSLARSRNLSKFVPLQSRTFSLCLTSSILERNGSEPAFRDSKAFTQMLREVCKSKAEDSTSRQKLCTDMDAEINHLKIDKILTISDSSDDKEKLCDDESTFVASYKVEDYLRCLEHVINMKSTSTLFVEELLKFFAQNSDTFITCLKYREPMFISMLNKWMTKDSTWMADEIARLFLQVCVALSSEQRLLLKCADAVMKQGLLHQHCHAVTLATCILIRLGLLKGEYDVCIVRDLKGPLLALEHVFLEDYFPRNLAGIFTSFFCKSSPKLFGLDEPRLRALASAVTKEVLPTSLQEAENDAGKSFKRICDIVALEEDWEPLLKCVDALFSHIFITLKCRVLPIGESILIHLGLLKSEFSIEIVRNLKCALNVLHHMAKQNYFSPDLKQLFLCFLRKPNPSLYSCFKEVDELLSALLNSQADL